MAFIGNIEKLCSFIKENRNHPLVKYQLDKSGLSAGEINSYEDFLKIEKISKQEYSALQNKELPFRKLMEHGRAGKVFISPGPIFNLKGEEFEHYRLYKALEKAGFKKNDVVVNSFGYHMSPAGDMFDEAPRKLGCVVVPMGIADTEKGAETVKQTGANAFIGVKTYLVKVLEALGSENTIEKAYLIAEKVTEEDRKMIKDKFGVDAYQGYGIAEVGLIATECSSFNGWHVDTDSIFVEIIDPETGEPADTEEEGECVVSFMNGLTPFIRLGTGDISKAMSGECACVDNSGRLAGIFGRVDASVKVKGVFIHFWQLEAFFAGKESAGKLVIDTDEKKVDTLTVYSNIADTETIADDFKKTFGLRLNNVVHDDKIEKTESIDNRKHYKDR